MDRFTGGMRHRCSEIADALSNDTRGSDRDVVTSFVRGLNVIRAFTSAHRSMTLSEVAERTGTNRAATRRFLMTLVSEGYATTNGRKFHLLPKVLELGFSALASFGLTDVAQPVLNDLSDAVQETCFVVILDCPSVVYVAKSHSRRVMVATLEIGSRAPAYTMSSGRVLLSAFPPKELERYLRTVKLKPLTPHTVASKLKLKGSIEETRRLGYSVVDQEYEIGLRSISVPIRNRSGEIIAALNVACPSPRFTLEDMRVRLLPKLLNSASKITQFLL
jgi:IclR family transcriptional regulator, pca regulon regulatory protein